MPAGSEIFDSLLLRRRGGLVRALVGSAALLCASCTPKYHPPIRPATTDVLSVTHQAGGAHHRVVVHGDACYEAFASKLLVVEPATAVVLRTIEFGEPGRAGPVIDLAICDRSLFAVIEDDEVVKLSLASPRNPQVAERISSDELGIHPRRLSVVQAAGGSQVFASGPGGVVRLGDRHRMLSHGDDVGRVANTEGGLAVCIGRRVHRLEDRSFIGSATDLEPITPELAAQWKDQARPGPERGGEQRAAPALVFVRQGDEGALVGLMSSDVREIDSRAGVVAVAGVVRSARAFGNRLWVVNDEAIIALAIRAGELREEWRFEARGARDVAGIGEHRLAVCGTFGRAVLEIPDEALGGSTVPETRSRAGALRAVHPEPGLLTSAYSDGRYVLAGAEQSWWTYLIGTRAEPSEHAIESAPASPRSVATLQARVTISEDGRVLQVSSASAGGAGWSHVEPRGTIMRCVVAIDGALWIGHDRGITVLHPGASQDQTTSERVRIPGSVRFLFPLLIGGGAAYVSEEGGFGVARYVTQPAASK